METEDRQSCGMALQNISLDVIIIAQIKLILREASALKRFLGK
jgi:hypothetical protein